MNYKVILTDTAKQDLRDIAFWIVDQSKSKETAKRFISELRAHCDKLKHFPNIGSLPSDRVLKSLGYRFITHKDYLIFYSTDEFDKTVNIMAIFNTKKDYMRVMSKFI